MASERGGMMDKLIRRGALIKNLENSGIVDSEDDAWVYTFVIAAIEETPTVDAVPVVHAEWEDCGWVELDEHGGFTAYPHEGMRCSNCNRAFKKELLWTDNFCPNCGADMRKKVQE